MIASNEVLRFNRFEFKYVLTDDQMRSLIDELAGYTYLDPHSQPGRGYQVYSVYWDSSDLGFFWEKVDGQKYRRKLRFRLYAGGEDAYVEIKQRVQHTVQKRRARMPRETIRRLFGGGADAPELDPDTEDQVTQEALFLCRYYDLAPVVAVDYRRQAFFGAHERDLRLTFDTRLQYDPLALDLEEPFEVGKVLLPPDRAILEIKFNDRVPLWLTRLVARHRLEIVRYSKYCAAVDREFFGGRYT